MEVWIFLIANLKFFNFCAFALPSNFTSHIYLELWSMGVFSYCLYRYFIFVSRYQVHCHLDLFIWLLALLKFYQPLFFSEFCNIPVVGLLLQISIGYSWICFLFLGGFYLATGKQKFLFLTLFMYSSRGFNFNEIRKIDEYITEW